jgi:ATP-dependent Clp protease adaptor protein ClpS
MFWAAVPSDSTGAFAGAPTPSAGCYGAKSVLWACEETGPLPLPDIKGLLWYIIAMPFAGNRTETVQKNRRRLKEPDEYRVILLNDNYTTMEFVIEVLMKVFHKPEDDATQIMLDVHTKGKGIVGVYSWDIAQTRVNQVHNLARQYEFPLRCVVEKA